MGGGYRASSYCRSGSGYDADFLAALRSRALAASASFFSCVRGFRVLVAFCGVSTVFLAVFAALCGYRYRSGLLSPLGALGLVAGAALVIATMYAVRFRNWQSEPRYLAPDGRVPEKPGSIATNPPVCEEQRSRAGMLSVREQG